MTKRPSPAQSNQHSRKLISYLLLPRPGDAFKVSIPLSGWLIANLSTNWQWWREGLVLAIAFEYLICQARYQWNDLQGRAWDFSAPMAASRGRLPPTKYAMLLSTITIALRLSLALAICLFPWPSQIWPKSALCFGFGALGVILLTLIYEQTRRVQRNASSYSFASFAFITLLTMVGYPLRFAAGFSVTAPSLSLWRTTPLAGYLIAIALLGMVGVAIQWLLEAASYATFDASGKVIAMNRKILAKPHIYQNWLYAGFEGELQENTPMNGSSVFTLKKIRTHAWQLWNLSYFTGSFMSIVSIMAPQPQPAVLIMLAAICLGTLVLFELLGRISSTGEALCAATLLMLFLTWLATGYHTDLRAGVGATLGLLWMFVYFTFYQMNYSYILHMGTYVSAFVEATRQYAKHYLRTLNALHIFRVSQPDQIDK